MAHLTSSATSVLHMRATCVPHEAPISEHVAHACHAYATVGVAGLSWILSKDVHVASGGVFTLCHGAIGSCSRIY